MIWSSFADVVNLVSKDPDELVWLLAQNSELVLPVVVYMEYVRDLAFFGVIIDYVLYEILLLVLAAISLLHVHDGCLGVLPTSDF